MARRAWGEGSVFYDKINQRWTWRGTYLLNGIKTQKTLTAKRQIDLKEKVEKFKFDVGQGIYDNTKITVTEWIKKYLTLFIQPTVRPSTFNTYAEKLNFVMREFGKRKLKSLTAIELQNFFNSLAIDGGAKQQGLSPTSVNTIRRYFKAACQTAVKNHLITDNPVEGTKALRTKKPDIVIANEEEVLRLLAVAKEGKYIYEGIKNPNYIAENIGTKYYIKCFYNVVNLDLGTGLRSNELFGLRWTDINWQKGYIDLKKQLLHINQKYVFVELKTQKATRKIYLDEGLIRELRDWKIYQEFYAEMLGDKFNNENNLLFTNTFGGPVNVQNFKRRYYFKMLAAAGIKKGFNIHSMRHTHATLLLKHGVNPNVVADRLGHSNATVTLNIYAHVLENMEETAPNTWAQIMRGGENKT